jgi:hypothetical protein
MKYFATTAIVLALIASPAFAQSMPGTGQNGPSIQPKPRTPDVAPPALPGAGDAPGLATAPQVAHAISGDPTTALFDAINKNDYNAARDALSRGADVTAENPLGETPLELSIDLNHNSITFMILAARNEGGPDSGPMATGQAVVSPAPGAVPAPHKAHAVPAKLESPPLHSQPVYGSGTGTPNPSAGFNGFSGQ